MKTPGEPDPLYVLARTALLDALDALEPHLDAVVLVGAQAIYVHAGDADLTVAEHTTDADFSLSPADLTDRPLLADLLAAGGFTPREHPGEWLSPNGVYIDMMVPEALAGPAAAAPASAFMASARRGEPKGLKGPWSTASESSSPLSIRATRERSRCGSPDRAP